ncbi:glycerol-3-phosphate dehydrogenase/oxidase [Bordetella sp. BOR01]|uniref:glycerol-3-phosphate dehydrogenase/oxidase n=1 Tax=Bordetella sp. BOR01 TaxID=2854779 RepID=UPI001C47618A|nr:glycerol-3-phosphate dehydrogenase/oxidase [Bordetella sp. BOR01]MBV7485882.1 glycerol-3-phosphate dehydrogenase/oxidase [Bordetella sp. BOR01]
MTPVPASPPAPSRAALLDTLNDTATWDVIVIGGGATGLGTAVDAAARGYRTLLVEADDFAKGTSSKATKLVHGGVRYLAQGNIGLVREALHERGLLNRNAPHLVWPLGFVVPAYGLFDQPFYGIGLKMYDMLAGKLNLSPSRWLSRSETLAQAATVAPSVGGRSLRGGVLYYDGQFDDARLAMALMRTLFDLGGTALNYVRATGLTRNDKGAIDGVVVQDALGDAQYTLRARCVFNATGVWVDSVRRMDDAQAQTMVAPSQGVHLTLPRDFLPGDKAILIPKTDDGRVLFVVPWNGHTIVGTTDTPRNDLPLDPPATRVEVDFILQTAARYLSRKPTRADVTSVWAGLRPLVKATGGEAATKTLSREHTIVVSRAGLLTVTGGKWTTYRKMAQDVVDTAIQHQLLPQAHCRTADLPLHGASHGGEPDAPPRGTPDSYYGTDLPALRALPGIEHILVKSSGLTEAHVRFAARQELARSAEDVLARRNRALFLDSQAAMLAAPEVARILAEELGLDADWQRATVEDFGRTAAHYRLD